MGTGGIQNVNPLPGKLHFQLLRNSVGPDNYGRIFRFRWNLSLFQNLDATLFKIFYNSGVVNQGTQGIDTALLYGRPCGRFPPGYFNCLAHTHTKTQNSRANNFHFLTGTSGTGRFIL
jgi:hypothetical protein